MVTLAKAHSEILRYRWLDFHLPNLGRWGGQPQAGTGNHFIESRNMSALLLKGPHKRLRNIHQLSFPLSLSPRRLASSFTRRLVRSNMLLSGSCTGLHRASTSRPELTRKSLARRSSLYAESCFAASASSGLSPLSSSLTSLCGLLAGSRSYPSGDYLVKVRGYGR
jgi:hypothetical protein